MGKIYVLDISVLLEDTNSIFSFKDNEVVIPVIVLEELDKVKRYMDEVGRNARQVSRLIHDLTKTGDIHMKIPLENGGTMRIELNQRSIRKLPNSIVDDVADNEILIVTKNLSLEEKIKENGRSVVLVSKDPLLRVKADALGITAEDYIVDRLVI